MIFSEINTYKHKEKSMRF